MRAILKDGFFWRFAGGFAIGAIGLMILQPADAKVLARDLATVMQSLP
jgi:ethanolamine utilization microcompartment shell protein EutS